MSNQQFDRLLAQLAKLPNSISQDSATQLIRRGRPKPIFHTTVWLSRIGPQ